MKRFIWGALITLLIIVIFRGITNAFYSYDNSQTPISNANTLVLLGSGLVGIATWGRKKFKDQ